MKLNFLNNLILMFSLFIAGEAMSEPANFLSWPKSKNMKVETLNGREMSPEIHRMMSHLDLTMNSLELGMVDSASSHIASALSEVKSIEVKSQSDKMKTVIPFGRFRYQWNGKEAEHFVPVWEGDAVTEIIDDASGGQMNKIAIRDVSINHILISLDMKATTALMNKALESLKMGNVPNAVSEIQQIYSETFISEELIEEPIALVWANILLSREMIEKRNYQAARYTLRRAETELRALERDKKNMPNQLESKEIRSEINSLYAILNEKSPGVMLKAKNKTLEWARKVKKWARPS
jgi:hypothetical protein